MTIAPLGQDSKKINGLLQLALKYHNKKRYGEAAWLYQKIMDVYSRFYSKDLEAVEYARINLDDLTTKIENLHPVKPKELQTGDPLMDDNEPVNIDPIPFSTPLSSIADNTVAANSMRQVMGATRVTVRVENLTRSGNPYENEFLVATGAIDCLAPAGILKKAGIAVEGRDVYEMANGEIVEYPYGFARLSFMGSKTVAQIVFGPEDAEPILGVAALQNAGIGIDPVSRTLKRMAAKPLQRATWRA